MKTSAVSEELGYLEYFGLSHNPFPVAPDDENFYISDHIDQILVEIVHGIVSRKGFMVLTGDIGLGKTTISRRIISIIEEKSVETSLVFHTAYQDVALLNEINLDFGLKPESLDLGNQMKLLNNFLLEQNRQGKNCAIIIDDAQNLNQKSLELIRMISNLEADQQKLVQILLIGQPELLDTLNLKALRQLKSRIIIRKEVKPLNMEELKNYLQFKLNIAGNKGLTTFNKSALKKVHQLSNGNFRQVNILMDRCLYAAFLYNSRQISRKIVNEAFLDLEPDKFQPKNKSMILLLPAFLLLCFAGGFFYFDLPIRSSPAPSVIKMPVVRKKSAVSAQLPDTGLSLPQNGTKQMVKKDVDQKPAIPESISEFLSVYNFSEFAESFYNALQSGQFEAVSKTIFDKKGYRLIRIDHVPEHIRGKYDILAYPSNQEGKAAFFLFWQPELNLPMFYYSYQGEEILEFQKMLTKIGMYADQIDGDVGRNLMKAVINFQKQNKLPVNGYPDERTLFLLCNQKGDSYK